MTTDTLMKASGMNDSQIERHKALVARGYTVRDGAGGYDLVNEDKEVRRGPFRSREAAWQAAEENEGM